MAVCHAASMWKLHQSQQVGQVCRQFSHDAASDKGSHPKQYLITQQLTQVYCSDLWRWNDSTKSMFAVFVVTRYQFGIPSIQLGTIGSFLDEEQMVSIFGFNGSFNFSQSHLKTGSIQCGIATISLGYHIHPRVLPVEPWYRAKTSTTKGYDNTGAVSSSSSPLCNNNIGRFDTFSDESCA